MNTVFVNLFTFIRSCTFIKYRPYMFRTFFFFFVVLYNNRYFIRKFNFDLIFTGNILLYLVKHFNSIPCSRLGTFSNNNLHNLIYHWISWVTPVYRTFCRFFFFCYFSCQFVSVIWKTVKNLNINNPRIHPLLKTLSDRNNPLGGNRETNTK